MDSISSVNTASVLYQAHLDGLKEGGLTTTKPINPFEAAQQSDIYPAKTPEEVLVQEVERMSNTSFIDAIA